MITVEVYGREGRNAKRVNGKFCQHVSRTYGGKPVWRRIDMIKDPIVLWYWPKKKVWMMTRESGIGSEQAYAAVEIRQKTLRTYVNLGWSTTPFGRSTGSTV